jgi:hypothetical protein
MMVIVDTAPRPPDVAPVDMAPAPSTLRMGLVGRWKLDEGSGTSAADSSGAGNNGALTGPAWVTTGYPGADYPNPAALRFDGNDHVQLGTNNLPANNRPQTLALWLNYAAVPDANGQICLAITDGNAGGERLKLGFKEQRLAAFKSGNPPVLVDVAPPAPGWHHLAYSYDGTTNRLYVDGVQRATSTTAPDTGPANNARLGANFDGSEPFTGLLDEVRIYNRALTAAEIASLFAGAE